MELAFNVGEIAQNFFACREVESLCLDMARLARPESRSSEGLQPAGQTGSKA